MSKMKFNADEMMVMAMFEQPTRTETMRYIEEVVPFVEDDAEVFPLVAVRRSWDVWSGIPVHLQVFWQMSAIVVMYWQERPLHRTF